MPYLPYHTSSPPGFFLRTPPNLPPLTKTSHHDIISTIMSLLALILEALAGTVTLLSAPISLDRVLNQLCALPSPFSFAIVLTNLLLARMLPLGAGIE